VLLDPFEEQFDLPAILVKGSNNQLRQGKIVLFMESAIEIGGKFKKNYLIYKLYFMSL
jgi:hypothetical protein